MDDGRSTWSAVISRDTVRKGYVPKRNYISEPIRFWYKPLTIMAKVAYMDGIERQPNADAVSAVNNAFLSKHLVRWDLKYPEAAGEKAGKPVPTNDPDEIKSVLDGYVHRLIVAIMAGVVESHLAPEDEDESEKAPETPEEILEAMERASSRV